MACTDGQLLACCLHSHDACIKGLEDTLSTAMRGEGWLEGCHNDKLTASPCMQYQEFSARILQKAKSEMLSRH